MTSLVPRVYAEDGDGTPWELGDLEFLGLLQPVIEEAGLPWQHLDFDLDVDPSGESMVVSVIHGTAPGAIPPELGLERRLKLLARHVGRARALGL